MRTHHPILGIPLSPGEAREVERMLAREVVGAAPMQSLGSVLPGALARNAQCAPAPDLAAAVERLEAARQAATAPTCATCNDGGMVRIEAERGATNFGSAQPCPACGGAAARRAFESRLRTELRGRTFPRRSDIMQEALRTIDTDYLPLALDANPGVLSLAMEQIERARTLARSYTQAWPGTLFALDGPSGTLKSTLAAKLYACAWRDGYAAGWVQGSEIRRMAYDWRSDAGKSRVESNLQDYNALDLLIIDEADHAMHADSAGHGTEFLFDLVNTRHARQRGTVLTGNTLRATLAGSPVGRAILSRADSAGAVWCDMSAVPDARAYWDGRDEWQAAR